MQVRGDISWDLRDGELPLQRGFNIQTNKLRPRESSDLPTSYKFGGASVKSQGCQLPGK